jgi:hypothetical protein
MSSCATCGGALLKCSKCGHVGCNDQGANSNRPRPCPNRIDNTDSGGTRHCGMCGEGDLQPL